MNRYKFLAGIMLTVLSLTGCDAAPATSRSAAIVATATATPIPPTITPVDASPVTSDVPSQTLIADETAQSPIYEPLELDDWEVSTPVSEGLDPESVSRLYRKAEGLPNLYSLLIIKNGYLVAEQYFNGQNVRMANPTASVTKSYVSALIGIALREKVLSDVDQKMMEFFPEFAGQYSDPRKDQITLRHMLQMRSGYPWEEFSPYLDTLFSSSNWLPFIVDFPLSSDPGTEFGYSNLTAHVLGVILARASGSSLLSFGRTHLFEPLGVKVGYWPTDASGYYYGSGDISFTPRDMAKFGLLYLNGGDYKGAQLIPVSWVAESLRPYSHNIYSNRLGTYLRQIEYGYLWWSAKAGHYEFDFAWGHGGNLIILVHDLDMVIVATADHLAGQFGDAAWQKERAVIDLVGGFIAAIPSR
jgi:CubicO group peptidase (beta-lactamase class C family)